jgi:hypothetical protein
MVPYVHFGIIEQVFHRTVAPIEIRMIQMPNGYSNVEDDVGLTRSEPAKKHDHDILHGSVEDILHPVVSEMGRKAHLLNRMMHLMETPKEFEPMQKHMGEPLDEVRSYEENKELRPVGKITQVKKAESGQVPAKEIGEESFGHIGKGEKDDYLEDVKIEEHVKGIQPEVLSNDGLVLAPGHDDFQTPHD